MHLHRTSGERVPKEKVELVEEEEEEDEFFPQEVERPALMPAPIDDERSCKYCYVSDACMLFRKVSFFSLSCF